MMNILIVDCETTGLPNFKLPADAPEQPRIAQIAWLKIDAATREEVDAESYLIRPDGWSMPPEMAELLGNGITQERLEAEGVGIVPVLADYAHAHADSALLVAYNKGFDLKMIRGEMRRAGMPDLYGALPEFCPMTASKDLCAMPPTERMLQYGFKGFKQPKLSEAHRILMGVEMDGAHDALHDCRATARVMWHLHDRGMCEPLAAMMKAGA